MMKPVWQIFKFPLDNGSLYSFQLTTGRKRDGIETGCLPDRPNPSLIYIHASFSNPPRLIIQHRQRPLLQGHFDSTLQRQESVTSKLMAVGTRRHQTTNYYTGALPAHI